MNIKELRAITGLSQQKFGDKYGIPRRTLQNWELGLRKAPDYTVKMLEAQIKKDYAK